MDIAPFRGLRYNLQQLQSQGIDDPAAAVTAPPYDVISPDEHQALLARCPQNVTALTLGSEPGGTSDYAARAGQLEQWIETGVMAEDSAPGFYAYEIDYALPVPGMEGERHRFVGLVALGRQHAFEEGVVLRHEETFPKVVDDRLKLLDATRTHLESIFLLYSDAAGEIDAVLQKAASGEPAIEVEAKPGERHALYRIEEADVVAGLAEKFKGQRPIIADGHHRYTMGHRYRTEMGASVPGSQWQLMTFANLHGDGLAILATHRLVKLSGIDTSAALKILRERFEASEPGERELRIETATEGFDVRFPADVRSGRSGAGATAYNLLQSVVFDEWLAGHVRETDVSYFKEATGESEALRDGRGDILFRMEPVGRAEFQNVVEGGEVYPHKTTYFYPKLWSGLVLWRLGAM